VKADGRAVQRVHRPALIASIVAAVGSALAAVTISRFTDVFYEGTVFIEMAAPALYVACIVAVFKLSNRSKHTFWLLVFAPVAFWPYLEIILIVAIWTIRGGAV
jgi:hypothetical protein